MGSGITIEGQVPNDGRVLGIPVNGLPTSTLNTLQFNNTTNQFDWVAAPVVFDGKHTSLTDKESGGVIDHANLSVTEVKLAALAVTEGKIGALAVSLAKMKTEVGNADLFIGYDGSGVVVAKAGGGGMGDLEFLKQQIDLGDFLQARGTRAASSGGVITSVTPASGKTYYQIYASISFDSESDRTGAAELRNNTTIRVDLVCAVGITGFTGYMPTSNYFDVMVGSGALVYDINNKGFGAAGPTIAATMEGFLTDT